MREWESPEPMKVGRYLLKRFEDGRMVYVWEGMRVLGPEVELL